MALPFDGDRFDAAVMALVISFVPEPVKGVAEMARVVRPGGIVAAYAWDMLGGGFPFEPVYAELRAMGVAPAVSPSAGVDRIDALHALWTDAGLEAVETREIAASRTFADFEDFWNSSTASWSIRPALAAMTTDDLEQFKMRTRARLSSDASGRVTCQARANAVTGRVPR